MKRAVHRAGFRPLAMGSTRLLLRPAALKIAAFILFILLTLGLYSLSAAASRCRLRHGRVRCWRRSRLASSNALSCLTFGCREF